MNVPRLIAAGAVCLAVAAAVAGWVAASNRPDLRVAGVASQSGPPGAEGGGAQDFALPEVAVSELEPGSAPFAFVVEVTPPGGTASTVVAEASLSGRAMLPPVPPDSALAVSVVAGGARFGYAWEETLGTSEAKAPVGGGRFAVVVPARRPPDTETPLRVFVSDPDGWPVAGARVTEAAHAWTATTSASGYCIAGSAAATVHVEPPAERPDLAAFDASPGLGDHLAEIRFGVRRTADVRLPPADAGSGPADGAEVVLRPYDGRPFLRRVLMAPSRVVAGLALGRCTAAWVADGSSRGATIEVAPDASRLVPSQAQRRVCRVEVAGNWRAFEPTIATGLVLVERSPVVCGLPRSIVESNAFEQTDGRGYTARHWTASIDADGTAVFEDVPPGEYEIASMSDPYAVARCVTVDGRTDPVRVVCAPRLRAAQIVGRIAGPAGGRYVVEVRALGRAFDISRDVTCPGDYEFGDLAGGLYSVRAVSAEAGRPHRRDRMSGVTPWRNVVVEPAGRVTVDFRVE